MKAQRVRRSNLGRELPAYRPQLATLVDAAPEGDGWLHELKYDGYRIGCVIDRGRVQLQSRRGNDWTQQFPEIVDAVRRLPIQQALLDGEVAIVTATGQTSFQALQNAFSGATRRGLTYFVFDLLYLDGRDLAALPLLERKRALEDLLRGTSSGPLKYSPHVEGNGPAVLAQACKIGAEGIVSKRKDQPYRAGRNDGWLKSKCVQRQEFVIGGFTDPEGSRQGIGSLLIGHHDERGRLVFAGKVGTGRGFTATFTMRLRADLESIEVDQPAFDPLPPAPLCRVAHWVRPERVAEVVFSEWTEGGSVRHGSVLGVRADKHAGEVTRERPRRATNGVEVSGVVISSPERSIYPELAFTKLDLARLYADLAEWILPYVANRPLTLVRCEKGVTRDDALRSECKFLRHEPGYHRWAGPALHRVAVSEQRKSGEYLLVDSREGLVELVQGDILELHCWNSTSDHLERPDRFVFDLDPAPNVPFDAVVAAAELLRRKLESVGLESWPKLSGNKGVHVVVPFQPELDWSQAYEVARRIAEAVVREDPSSLTVAFEKVRRDRKILVDYKRNHRAAVAVAAYSARATPRGSVSLPVTWAELRRQQRADRHTVESVRRRLSRLSRDPWRELYECRQRLGGGLR